ncbi:MAG: DnaJ domain-containing protein [Hungatella sp.]|nr:DnaJ domain-containing protein [Hungatella sp.]
MVIVDSYYHLLGADRNADSKSLKSGYFKAIRKYPPDTEPEMFKEVRKAYEILMNPEKRKEYDEICGLKPEVQKAYYEIINLMEQKAFEEGIRYCDEVMLREGSQDILCFLQGKLYLLNNNPGKAVREFEMLSGKEPENTQYLMSLALACEARGWNKKALKICEEMESRGCSRRDFMVLYGTILTFQSAYSKAYKKLKKASESSCDAGEENWGFIKNSWGKILETAVENLKYFGKNYLELFFSFLENDQMPEECRTFLCQMFFYQFHNAQDEEKYTEIDEELFDKLLGQFQSCKDHISEKESWMLEMACYEREKVRLFRDKRFPDLITELGDIFYENIHFMDMGTDCKEEYDQVFLAAKVTLIYELPGIKKSLRIIKQEYPYYAGILGDFLDEILGASSRAFLLNKYEKRAKKMFRAMEQEEQFLDDWFQEEWFRDEEPGRTPYRRQQPRIGRNQPCPCGSGKKYKNCCGKN